MINTLLDAKAKLEAEGLYVSSDTSQSLWIAATLRDSGAGIRVSDNACAVLWRADGWVAVFPAEGLCTFELPGGLPELVSIILQVYHQYRQVGGELKDAFRQVVGDPDQYVVGRSVVHV